MKEINNIGLWECLKSLHPNADFSIYCGEIIWREENIECPTKEELEAEQKKLLTEYDAKSYARSRQDEYPSIQECIHALLDGGDTLTELQTKRSKIKQKYPKPT